MLEEDHYGLEKVKDRVLEYLAVRKLKSERAAKGEIDPGEIRKGPILLFVGPPRRGQDLDRQVDRQGARARVRAHQPRRRARRVRHPRPPPHLHRLACPAASSRASARRAPRTPCSCSTRSTSSASRTRATPPRRCSRCSIRRRTTPSSTTTSASPSTSPRCCSSRPRTTRSRSPTPLYDRMEPIEFSSYVELEKQEIAKRYLLPRQLPENGLKANQFTITDGALSRVISALHPRGRRAPARAHDRHAGPQGRPQDRRRRRQARAPHRTLARGLPGRRALHPRVRERRGPGGRRHRHVLHARRRRHPVRRDERDQGQVRASSSPGSSATS